MCNNLKYVILFTGELKNEQNRLNYLNGLRYISVMTKRNEKEKNFYEET